MTFIPDAVPCRVSREKLSHEGYHASTGINCSALDLINRSELHYWNDRVRPDRKSRREPTAAMEFGTAFHAMIESEEAFRSQYALAPDCRRGTKEWVAAETAAGGRKLLKRDEMIRLEEMRASFIGHPFLRAMIFAGNDASFEETFYWHHTEVDDDGNVISEDLCKARTDIYIPGLAIIDTKVSHDGLEEAFQRTCFNFSYHRRAAWYIDGIYKVTGELLPYVFALIEPEAPHAVSVFVATPRMVDAGRLQNAQLLKRLLKAKRTGVYPGYPSHVREIDLPEWAYKLIEKSAAQVGAEEGAF